MNFALAFLLCLSTLLCANGLYFLVKEKPKCFTFEQPKDMPMFFTYRIPPNEQEVIFELFYGSMPRPEMQIMHKVLAGGAGHVDFTADNDGVYSYCLMKSDQYQQAPVKLSISLTYGFDSEHYQKLVEGHNFDAVNLQVHKLNDILTMTLNEADYQKHKEVEYHKDTEKMNSAALWWPVVQIIILILTGVYQVHHLKNFFKSNKFI
jgi:hypothetical protein